MLINVYRGRVIVSWHASIMRKNTSRSEYYIKSKVKKKKETIKSVS